MAKGYSLFSIGYNRTQQGCYYSGILLPTGTTGDIDRDFKRTPHRVVIHTKGRKVHNIRFTKINRSDCKGWCTMNPPNVLYGLTPINLEKLYFLFPEIETEIEMFSCVAALKN